MKIIFLILLFYSILLVSSVKLTDEQKKKWNEATGIQKELIATGIMLELIFEHLLENTDFKGEGCYKGAPIIPECPKDTEEVTIYFPYMKRKCYKLCKANEIRKNHVCHYCESGVQIQEELELYDDYFYKKFVCGTNGEKPKAYKTEVEPDHCMKNTVKDQDVCDIDCSILGLKHFGLGTNGYCAKDETEYKELLKCKIKMDLNAAIFDLKFLFSKLFQEIFDPLLAGFKTIIYNYCILSKKTFVGNNFEKVISECMTNIFLKKQLLKQAGKEIFIKQITDNFLDLLGKDTSQNIIDSSEKFINSMWERMVDTKELDSIKPGKKMIDFFIGSLNQLINFVDILKIQDHLDFISKCHNSKEFDFDECIEGILNELENFDPTLIVNFIRMVASSAIPICNINVKPENSRILYFAGGEPYPLFFNTYD